MSSPAIPTYSPPASGAISPRLGGATFSVRNRLSRLVWHFCWLTFAAWTPHRLQPLRRFILELFGARIHPTAMIRGSVRIWHPANLSVGAYASLGPGVICYDVAPITVMDHAIISQRAHLCTGTHAIDHPDFPLVAKPIVIGENAWIAAEAFVGPGVTIGKDAVLGARAVAFRDLETSGVYVGNPAVLRRHRKLPGQ
jgi:putative colanic acid biosynthesis acetyltransferase WcaF